MTEKETAIANICNKFEFSGGWADHMELEVFKQSLDEAYEAGQSEDKEMIKNITINKDWTAEDLRQYILEQFEG